MHFEEKLGLSRKKVQKVKNIGFFMKIQAFYRFSHKASSVLEKKIFKGFYHIWTWWPSWSMDSNHFSNLSFPCPRSNIGPEAPEEKSFGIINIFSIQMHREAILKKKYLMNFCATITQIKLI